MINEQGDKLSEADKGPLQKSLEKVRQLAKGDNTQAIKSALEDLEQAAQAVGKVIYQRAQSCGATADCASGSCAGHGQAGSSATDDEAIDAEFEVRS